MFQGIDGDEHLSRLVGLQMQGPPGSHYLAQTSKDYALKLLEKARKLRVKR